MNWRHMEFSMSAALHRYEGSYPFAFCVPAVACSIESEMRTRDPELLQSALFVVFVIMNYQSHARSHSSAALASCQDSMHV